MRDPHFSLTYDGSKKPLRRGKQKFSRKKKETKKAKDESSRQAPRRKMFQTESFYLDLSENFLH